MSIKDFPEKIKPYWQNNAIPLISKIKEGFDIKEDIFIILAIFLIGLAGFGLGKLSALEKGREMVQIKPAKVITATDGAISLTPIDPALGVSILPVKTADVPMSASALIATESAKGFLVAAKTGTKYYFPWCSGVSKISEKNKVWFDSYEAAQKTGLTAAANCPNLK